MAETMDGIRSGIISCWCGKSETWGGSFISREAALAKVLTPQQETGH